MKRLSWAKAREWLPVVFLAAVAIYAAVAIALYTRSVAIFDQSLAAQQKADHQAILSHESLLKRVEADEHRYCAAARASGDQAIVKIVCPPA